MDIVDTTLTCSACAREYASVRIARFGAPTEAQMKHLRCPTCRHKGLWGFFYTALLMCGSFVMVAYVLLGGRFTRVKKTQSNN